jgi:hypothetical protein
VRTITGLALSRSKSRRGTGIEAAGVRSSTRFVREVFIALRRDL